MEINQLVINVRFSEVDSMQIAHNAAFYIWFEDGRFDFSFQVLKLSEKSLNTDILLPVVKSSCKYLKHIRFGEKLLLNTYLYVGETAKIIFFYELYNTNKELCAIGKTEHVFLKASGGIMLRIPPEVKELFDVAYKKNPKCFFLEANKIDFEKRMGC